MSIPIWFVFLFSRFCILTICLSDVLHTVFPQATVPASFVKDFYFNKIFNALGGGNTKNTASPLVYFLKITQSCWWALVDAENLTVFDACPMYRWHTRGLACGWACVKAYDSNITALSRQKRTEGVELSRGLHVTLWIVLLSPFGILTICWTWHSVSPCRRSWCFSNIRLDPFCFYEVTLTKKLSQTCFISLSQIQVFMCLCI